MQERISRVRQSISSVYLGNPEAVDQVLCSLLARGHVLIEDVPGVGKTILATALAKSIDCSFSRIQLTPDLLPSDILGVSVYVREAGLNKTQGTGGGVGRFEFRRGPIFANIVLADEINRTPPRTQTALLEAMSEGTVTVDGRTYPLDRPFVLIATQNPYDFEGTYPLPENQLDRFLMRIGLGYPTRDAEADVLLQRPADHALQAMRPMLSASDVRELQEQVDRVRLDRALIDYIVAIADVTRRHGELQVGISPRGSLALAQASRATAILAGRDYVIPDDITKNLLPVCAHRVVAKSYTAVHSAVQRPDGKYPAGSPQAILLSVLEGIRSPD